MAGPDAIGAIATATTSPTQFANPASKGAEASDQVSLSDMAQRMLSGVSELQTDMQQAMHPDPSGTTSVAEASGKGEMGHLAMLSDQIHRSAEVQQQLTRFVMASSMSSSLGRNLNMFLRGQ